MKIPPLGTIKKALAVIPGACVAIVSQFALHGTIAHDVTVIGIIASFISVYIIGPNDPPASSRTLAEATTAPVNTSQGTSGTPGT